MRDTLAALPPGPRLPSVIQSVIWFRRAQWLMDTCQARFGDTFTLRILKEDPWVVTSNPETVKQVFTGDSRLLHAGESNRFGKPVFGPNSLLLLDEEPHLKRRRLMLPPFHGERLRRYGELMAAVTREEIERWPVGEPYRVRPRMQEITLDIILRTVFGVSEGPRMEDLRDAIHDLLDVVMSRRGGIVLMALGAERLSELPSFRRVIEGVNRPIYDEIADRRRAEDLTEREDILSLLLQAKHEDGGPMSDEELRDELVTLLLAGHETNANALAWAVERLCRHPEKLERLSQEVRAGEDSYLEAVVLETLRLRPVIAIVQRRLVEPMEIGGHLLPAGISIVPSIYLVHRRGDIYPEPNEFRPERFLDGRAPGTYTWIPFGGGVRRCLGGAFAQFQMETVLRELVRLRTVRPTRAAPEPVYRRAVAETPRHDVEVILARRPAETSLPPPPESEMVLA
jgi:cytochrome P450 family 135